MKLIKNLLFLWCCLIAAPFALEAKVLTTAQAQKNLGDAVAAFKKDQTNAELAQQVLNSYAALQAPAVKAAADKAIQTQLGKNINQVKAIAIAADKAAAKKTGLSDADAEAEANLQVIINEAQAVLNLGDPESIKNANNADELKAYNDALNQASGEVDKQAAKLSTASKAKFAKDIQDIKAQLSARSALVAARIAALSSTDAALDAKVAAIKNARNVIDDIHAKAYAIANSIAKLFGGKPTAEQLNDELKKINEIKKIATQDLVNAIHAMGNTGYQAYQSVLAPFKGLSDKEFTRGTGLTRNDADTNYTTFMDRLLDVDTVLANLEKEEQEILKAVAEKIATPASTGFGEIPSAEKQPGVVTRPMGGAAPSGTTPPPSAPTNIPGATPAAVPTPPSAPTGIPQAPADFSSFQQELTSLRTAIPAKITAITNATKKIKSVVEGFKNLDEAITKENTILSIMTGLTDSISQAAALVARHTDIEKRLNEAIAKADPNNSAISAIRKENLETLTKVSEVLTAIRVAIKQEADSFNKLYEFLKEVSVQQGLILTTAVTSISPELRDKALKLIDAILDPMDKEITKQIGMYAPFVAMTGENYREQQMPEFDKNGKALDIDKTKINQLALVTKPVIPATPAPTGAAAGGFAPVETKPGIITRGGAGTQAAKEAAAVAQKTSDLLIKSQGYPEIARGLLRKADSFLSPISKGAGWIAKQFGLDNPDKVNALVAEIDAAIPKFTALITEIHDHRTSQGYLASPSTALDARAEEMADWKKELEAINKRLKEEVQEAAKAPAVPAGAAPAPSKYSETMFNGLDTTDIEQQMEPLFEAKLTPEEKDTINKALDNAKTGKTGPQQAMINGLKLS